MKLGGSHAASPLLAGWLDAAAAGAGRVVLVPGGGPFADAVRAVQPAMGISDAAAHDMGLLAMAQYGRALADLRSCLTFADSLEAIETALAAHRVPVWSPWPMLRSASDIPATWDVTSDSLALWLAARIGAAGLVLVKHVDLSGAAVPATLIDAAFPRFRVRFAGLVTIAGPSALPGAAAALAAGALPGLTLQAEAA